jgi:cytochrome c5
MNERFKGVDALRSCAFDRLVGWTTLLTLLAGQLSAESADRSQDDKFAGETAWQKDANLARKWQEITGRFIFQRTCLSCHKEGPGAFKKTEWQSKLNDFPDQMHDELLPPEFEDLTAMFPYGRMVPNDRARYQSIETFLLENAPDQKNDVAEGESSGSVDLLPIVGQEAPDFSIQDVDGEKHTLKKYIQDKKALILVFSRAHW